MGGPFEIGRASVAAGHIRAIADGTHGAIDDASRFLNDPATMQELAGTPEGLELADLLRQLISGAFDAESARRLLAAMSGSGSAFGQGSGVHDSDAGRFVRRLAGTERPPILRPPRIASEEEAWTKVRLTISGELAEFRRAGKKEQKERLEALGIRIVDRIKQRHGTNRIGFHFNLHGGQPDEYLSYGGIMATMGDIRIEFAPSLASRSHSVYFFASDRYDLYGILDERNPQMVFYGRMGHVMTLFRLDSEYLARAFAEGGASNDTGISIDFDLNWMMTRHGGRRIGIPKETFIGEPVRIFNRAKKKAGITGWKFTRDEETFITMKFIEAVYLPE